MYPEVGGSPGYVPWCGKLSRVYTMGWEAVSGVYYGVGGGLGYVSRKVGRPGYVPWGGRIY